MEPICDSNIIDNSLTVKGSKTMEDFTFDDRTHQYLLNGVQIPSVTQVLMEAGLVNLDFISKDLLEQKADLGIKVHLTTELYDQGNLILESLHPTLLAYLNSYIKFKMDYNFIVQDIELKSYHKLFRYAGRIDRIGTVSGKLSIIDIKSGTVQPTHALQLAGYSELYNQDKKLKDQIRKRYCVYLSQDGYVVKEYNNPTDKNIFLAALTITNYKRSIS